MANSVQIKFITSGWSAAFGAFSEGDILRCSSDAASHFVEEAKCAEYVKPPAQAPEPAADPAAVQAPASAPVRAKRATRAGTASEGEG